MRSPVFVVGSGRSGTTMLRLMLDSHPLLAIPGESTFIRYMWLNRRDYWNGRTFQAERLLRDILADPNFRRWGVAEASVLDVMRGYERPDFADVIAAPFEAYARLQGKPRWGDKTPNYVLSIPALARLFPQARFVHVIRDGRDVALSYLAIPAFGSDIRAAAWLWRDRVGAGLRWGRRLGRGRYTEVRYEGLVDDPERELRRLCSFLGLPFTDGMLRYHVDASERLQVPPDRVRFHENVSRPPVRPTKDWRERMAPDDLTVFESLAGDLLSELGYARASGNLSRGARVRATSARALHRMHLTASAAKKEASGCLRNLVH